MEEWILSIPLPERAKYFTVYSLGAIFHSRANTGCSVYWEIHLAKRAILKELIYNIPLLKIIYCIVYSHPVVFDLENNEGAIAISRRNGGSLWGIVQS